MAVNALSDRMVAVIREKEGLAYRLGAGVRGLPDGSWFVSASVGTRPENRERVEQLFDEVTRELATKDLPTSEIERLAARVRQREMLARLSAGARASRLSRLLFEGESAPLAVDGASQARVGPAQLRQAAQSYLGGSEFIHTVAW